MYFTLKVKRFAAFAVVAFAFLVIFFFPLITRAVQEDPEEKSYIKWVDFNIPASLMKKAIALDVESHQAPANTPIDWIEVLAYLGTKCGGDFSNHKDASYTALIESLQSGETIEKLSKDMKNYAYYYEAYSAVLGGFVGTYELETEEGRWEKRYGLKAFSPIAKTFPYSDYDDFGNGRDYGYQRKHLGHDMMAATGTPVIAVESGIVEVMGWNQYGGWRIGIRSFDGIRYHYYAHLRQNSPFAEGLEEGQVVMAGDVIGYVGRTGYSTTENTNNIDVSHLHYGLQLIFDESQKEGVNQIWIDVYDICNLLKNNQTETIRNDRTKERTRVQAMREPLPEKCFPDF